MPKMIFVNLPVADVAKATTFYEALGFVRNPQFSNAQGASLTWSESIHIGVLDRAFYGTLTTRPIADTQASSAALFALSFDSRAEVDAITEAAIAAGGREAHEPEDLGFMYSSAFWDLDGHAFGPMWMDLDAATAATSAPDAA